MKNGDGLRVVLWVSGCNHRCKGCHNPQTWDCNSGIPFDQSAKQEIFRELEKDYISGITFSGGDPLHPSNVDVIAELICSIKVFYPNKTVWLYTGYEFEVLHRNKKLSFILNNCDVVVVGKFVQELADQNYKWAGSTNQRILRKGEDY